MVTRDANPMMPLGEKKTMAAITISKKKVVNHGESSNSLWPCCIANWICGLKCRPIPLLHTQAMTGALLCFQLGLATSKNTDMVPVMVPTSLDFP